jgi:hypothetical protein
MNGGSPGCEKFGSLYVFGFGCCTAPFNLKTPLSSIVTFAARGGAGCVSAYRCHPDSIFAVINSFAVCPGFNWPGSSFVETLTGFAPCAVTRAGMAVSSDAGPDSGFAVGPDVDPAVDFDVGPGVGFDVAAGSSAAICGSPTLSACGNAGAAINKTASNPA